MLNGIVHVLNKRLSCVLLAHTLSLFPFVEGFCVQSLSEDI